MLFKEVDEPCERRAAIPHCETHRLPLTGLIQTTEPGDYCQKIILFLAGKQSPKLSEAQRNVHRHRTASTILNL